MLLRRVFKTLGPERDFMLENLGLAGGVSLIIIGALLSYLGMQSVAADANLILIGGSVMFALGLITVATVLKHKLEFRRHYKKHHRN